MRRVFSPQPVIDFACSDAAWLVAADADSVQLWVANFWNGLRVPLKRSAGMVPAAEAEGVASR